MSTIPLLGVLLVAAVVAVVLFIRLRTLNSQHERLAEKHSTLSQEHSELSDRLRGIIDADAEKRRVLSEAETQRARLIDEGETEKQRALDEAAAERRRIVAEAEAERGRVLGSLESAHARLLTEVARLQADHGRAAEVLEEQRRLGDAEVEAIRSRACGAENQALQAFQEQQRRHAIELESLQSNVARLRSEVHVLDEEAHLQSFGFYKPRYNFESATRFQAALEDVREQQKWMIKNKAATACHIEWTVDGSRAEGRKQVNQTFKLMLRAFNGESDASIAKVRYNNVHVMEARIEKAFDAINNLVGVQRCEITPGFLKLKLQELYLMHEYQEKVQEEKEEQRRIREQMREEEIAIREMERAQAEAEREERRYADALRKAQEEAERTVGAKQQKLLGQIEELQRKLEEAHTNKERAIARAQMTRSGHVYVISNIGSFGEHVYKIGMTRRLDPLDRVRELGDASVPFLFDVHAIIYSDDAPTLESTLHRTFHHRRLNRINERKEFFRVTIEEIAEVVRQHRGEIEITLAAEAEEYRKTLAMLQSDVSVSVAQTTPVMYVRE